MTPPEQLWTLERTLAFIAETYGDEAEIAKQYALIVASEIVYDYEAERSAQSARIAELEAQLAAPKPRKRKGDPYVRAGLLQGRVQMGGEFSTLRPVFEEALQMATTDDLMWALNLLIKHPNARRTWRDYRIKHIDKRIREITGTP